jgi:hypothetical protein
MFTVLARPATRDTPEHIEQLNMCRYRRSIEIDGIGIPRHAARHLARPSPKQDPGRAARRGRANRRRVLHAKEGEAMSSPTRPRNPLTTPSAFEC